MILLLQQGFHPDFLDHPFASLAPLATGDRVTAIANSLAKRQIEPIVLYEGKILDGRSRYRALKSQGLPARFEEFVGTRRAALAYARLKMFQRKDLSEGQRAVLEKKFATIFKPAEAISA